jgi:hypothetical protein
MNEQEFWEIIKDVHDRSDGDMDEKCRLLLKSLKRLSSEEALAFARFFDTAMDRAYTYSLWGAAYVIQGGCGDDSFTDFRASLISRGHKAFERALTDPDSLAGEDFDEEGWFYEGYQYAVTEGVEAVAGAPRKREVQHPLKPSGYAWSEEEVYGLYPRLNEKFG